MNKAFPALAFAVLPASFAAPIVAATANDHNVDKKMVVKILDVECTSDYGAINTPCCGQVPSAVYTYCPVDIPYCHNYEANVRMGTCYATEPPRPPPPPASCTSDYGAINTPCCGQVPSAVYTYCPVNIPHCTDYIANVQMGTCVPAPPPPPLPPPFDLSDLEDTMTKIKQACTPYDCEAEFSKLEYYQGKKCKITQSVKLGGSEYHHCWIDDGRESHWITCEYAEYVCVENAFPKFNSLLVKGYRWWFNV